MRWLLVGCLLQNLLSCKNCFSSKTFVGKNSYFLEHTFWYKVVGCW